MLQREGQGVHPDLQSGLGILVCPESWVEKVFASYCQDGCDDHWKIQFLENSHSFFCGFCRPFFTSAFQTSCFRVFFGFIFVVFCISVVQVLLPCTGFTFRKCHPHFIISCALRSHAATQCSNTAAEFVRLDLGQRGTAGKKKSDF